MRIFATIAILLSCPCWTHAEDSGKRYLIIHADDAGMSHSVNMGTIEGVDPSQFEPIPWNDGVNHPSDR